jgi:hypothetical protein
MGITTFQPADPLDQWCSPPFSLAIRDDDLYGRGACDDKDQLFTHIKALEAFMQTEGVPPVNVRCLIEDRIHALQGRGNKHLVHAETCRNERINDIDRGRDAELDGRLTALWAKFTIPFCEVSESVRSECRRS